MNVVKINWKQGITNSKKSSHSFIWQIFTYFHHEANTFRCGVYTHERNEWKCLPSWRQTSITGQTAISSVVAGAGRASHRKRMGWLESGGRYRLNSCDQTGLWEGPFEQRCEGSVVANAGDIWRMGIRDRGDSVCKSPEAGAQLVFKKIRGSQSWQERKGQGEAREAAWGSITMDRVATGRGPVCTLSEMETRGWGNRETSPRAEPWTLITFRGEGDINHQAKGG